MVRPSSPWPFAAVFAIIVMSFIAATAFVHWRLSGIDRSAAVIANDAVPSIRDLAEARGELKRLEVVLQEQVEDHAAGQPADRRAVDASRRALAEAVAAYVSRPALPGERELYAAVTIAHEELDRAVERLEDALEQGNVRRAAALLRSDVDAAVTELFATITKGIEADARHVQELARDIGDMRAKTTYVAITLDAAATLIAVFGAVVVRGAHRRHAEIVERLHREERERAQELEHFAGRVAHDILGPLGAVGFALHVAGSDAELAKRQKALGAGARALERTKTLVTGLLEFARAGGKPAADARADLSSVLSDLAIELRPLASAAGIDLRSSTASSHMLACSPGVLTSLVSNLVRNAIKYIGDSPEPRIEVRAIDRGRCVRVEVEDTGPGLPPDVEPRVFDPYVRAAGTTQPGVGLGLATVKRLAEGHGGRVGVRSVPGTGSTFWFELPKAERVESAAVVDCSSPRTV